MKYDFFVSHASEDKDTVVRPLVALLKSRGFRVWYDEDVLRIGDSLSAGIDRGLTESRFGLVVLSPAFFGKHWTRRELQGLVALDEQGRSKILPIWHRVTKREVSEYSPTLADVIAGNTEHGLGQIVDALAATVQMAGPASEIVPELEDRPSVEQIGSTSLGGTVIFVHGLYGSSSGATRFFDHPGLREEAIVSHWEFVTFHYTGRNLAGARSSIDSTAQTFVEFIQERQLHRPTGKVVIVAHSVGGLVVMESILSSSLLRENLKAFIMIAVPTAGLRYPSLLGFINRGLRDISVGGRKVAEMNARWSRQFGNRPPFLVESIVAADDIVVSVSSAAFPGAHVTVVPGSHSDVYRQTPVIEVLKRILAAETA